MIDRNIETSLRSRIEQREKDFLLFQLNQPTELKKSYCEHRSSWPDWRSHRWSSHVDQRKVSLVFSTEFHFCFSLSFCKSLWIFNGSSSRMEPRCEILHDLSSNDIRDGNSRADENYRWPLNWCFPTDEKVPINYCFTDWIVNKLKSSSRYDWIWIDDQNSRDLRQDEFLFTDEVQLCCSIDVC